MKISVIIPHMEDLEGVEEALDLCVKSLKNEYDELIVVRNKGIGYGPAVNEGLSAATGDFLIVMNNDLRLVDGSLSEFVRWHLKLEEEQNVFKYIITPTITPLPRDIYPRCIFGMSREVYRILSWSNEQFFDERFEMGYWEDDDLIQRMHWNKIVAARITSLKFHHLNGGGLTMKQVGEQKYFDLNKKIFEEKWNV